MSLKGEWILFGGKNEALPQWLRSFYVDEDRQAWFPLAAFGDEDMLTICASFDGESLISNKGHAFAKSSWIEKEVNDQESIECMKRAKERALASVSDK